MRIIIRNDGKGKRQSVSASVSLVNLHTIDWHADVYASGYGATEQEARRNLRHALDTIAREVGTGDVHGAQDQAKEKR